MIYRITIARRKMIGLARRVLNICSLRRAQMPEFIVTMTTTFRVQAENEQEAYERAVEYDSNTNIVGVDYTIEHVTEK